ncbi:FMN-linked oxidoreductase [Lichtheimia hyalospora FSU 10163]|nr:FMN-linked oxidoreductase [Lichtheimia hyalospora FSU 10163]
MSVPSQGQNCKVPAGSALKEHDALLFKPKKYRSITLHNRIVVSPMCMYSCKDGMMNDFHLVHLGSFAVKGAGLIMMEATAVEPQGRISPDDSGLWSDDHIEPVKRIAEFIKSQGSVPGMQIAHAGRKADMSSPWKGYSIVPESEGGWPNDVRGPSEGVRFDENHPNPHALSKEQIQDIVQKFADTAIRADKAGIQVLEVHCAHGYLLHSFLSGNSNKRTDEYGGSLENRMRFPLQVVKAVREAWPEDKPVFVRVSATDYNNPDPVGHDPDGWDVWQTIEFAKGLQAIGVDLVDCSSGGNLPNIQYPVGPLYQVVLSDTVRKNIDMDTGAVGIITEPKDAEDILQKGKGDLIFIAREFLRDSAWVLLAAQELNVDVQWPNQYDRAKRALRCSPPKKEPTKSVP